MVLLRAGSKIADARVNIRPEDECWSDSIQRAIENIDRAVFDPLTEKASIELELSRAFKWPSAIPPHIELCVDADSPYRIVLNERDLGGPDSAKEQVSRFSISAAINERNRLVFLVENVQFDQLAEQLRGAWIEVWE